MIHNCNDIEIADLLGHRLTCKESHMTKPISIKWKRIGDSDKFILKRKCF